MLVRAFFCPFFVVILSLGLSIFHNIAGAGCPSCASRDSEGQPPSWENSVLLLYRPLTHVPDLPDDLYEISLILSTGQGQLQPANQSLLGYVLGVATGKQTQISGPQFLWEKVRRQKIEPSIYNLSLKTILKIALAFAETVYVDTIQWRLTDKEVDHSNAFLQTYFGDLYELKVFEYKGTEQKDEQASVKAPGISGDLLERQKERRTVLDRNLKSPALGRFQKKKKVASFFFSLFRMDLQLTLLSAWEPRKPILSLDDDEEKKAKLEILQESMVEAVQSLAKLKMRGQMDKDSLIPFYEQFVVAAGLQSENSKRQELGSEALEGLKKLVKTEKEKKVIEALLDPEFAPENCVSALHGESQLDPQNCSRCGA